MLLNGGVRCELRRSSRGPVPTLLIIEVVSSTARTKPVPLKIERAKVITCALDSIAKEQVRRKIAYGLKHTKQRKN